MSDEQTQGYTRHVVSFAATPEQPLDAATLGAALAAASEHHAYRVTVESWERIS